MTALIQMGHHHSNLIGAKDCGSFDGVVLSPVNECVDKMASCSSKAVKSKMPLVLFDPQLYCPKSQNGQLPSWDYYPEDIDTADTTSISWWNSISSSIGVSAAAACANACCTPAVAARTYGLDYYSFVLEVANNACKRYRSNGLRPFITVIARPSELSAKGRPQAIASVVSRFDADDVLLVFDCDTSEPRKELRGIEDIRACGCLCRALDAAGMKVTVAYTAADMILWKYFGAVAATTGKFFNLRRFTKSRFEPPKQGGGQIPYYFDEELLAFLREPDLLRLDEESMLPPSSQSSPAGKRIIEKVRDQAGAAWLADSWRHYLWSYSELSRSLDTGTSSARVVLAHAASKWEKIRQAGIRFEEIHNDGGWITAWQSCIQ